MLNRGNLIADTLFSLLDDIPYGAYAISIDQVILYWNRAAQRILGHEPTVMIGRRCYEVTAGPSEDGLSPECLSGCPSIRHLRAGLVPSPQRLQLACASGERKWVAVAPVVIAGISWEAPVLVHLFSEVPWDEALVKTGESLRQVLDPDGTEPPHDQAQDSPSDDNPYISAREVEVLRLVAQGSETDRIAEELGISPHTVRNHIRNLRNKLHAASKLEAVLTAVRLGILSVGNEPTQRS